jgi:hypothetical protein
VLWGKKLLPLLSDDSRGFAISLDLLLALIPITLVIGFVASDMDNLLFQMEDTVFRSSMDRAAGDAMSTLLETSGTPSDWEINGNTQIVGLAQLDPSTNTPKQGTVDPVKLAALNTSQVQQLVGNQYGFYFNASTINNSGTPVSLKTLGNSSFGSAKDVVRFQRIAQASQFKVVSSLIKQIQYIGGSRSFSIPTFQTSYNSNQTYDYWILIANNVGFTSVTVNVNNNAINFNGNNITQATMINSTFLTMNSTNPSQYYNNTVTLNATGSFPSSMDIYIVQAPKNTAPGAITTRSVVLQPSNFILYLWLKGN